MLKLVLTVSCLLLPISANAASHYVWCGATGAANGTEWTDAYTDLPSSLTRGDTYYVAGTTSCTYGYHDFNDVVSGTLVISIIKATSTNSGSISGWQSSFGTATADWDTVGGPGDIWTFNTSYYSVNGEYGSPPTADSYGFRLKNPGNSTSNVNFVDIDGGSSGTLSNVSVTYVEIDNGPINPDTSQIVGGTGVFTGSNGAAYSNLTLSYCYIHDINGAPVLWNNVGNSVIDHNWEARDRYTSTEHSEAISFHGGSYIVISNNVFQDELGTGGVVFLEFSFDHMYVFNNLFFNSQGQGLANWEYGDGSVFNNTGGTITNIFVFNNTLYNISGQSAVALGTTTNGLVENNLWWNGQQVAVGGATTDAYNTVINSYLNFGWACNGTGDSCQTSYGTGFSGSTGASINSASLTSNVVTVTTASSLGLSIGNPVLVIQTQQNSTTGCGVDTAYPYLTVASVSGATFTYDLTGSDVTCQSAGAVIQPTTTNPFVSPTTSPYSFKLTSDTVLSNLNDGTNLTSTCGNLTGTVAPNAPPCTIDPNGVSRPSTGNWDVGAYEYQASGNTTAAAAGVKMSGGVIQ